LCKLPKGEQEQEEKSSSDGQIEKNKIVSGENKIVSKGGLTMGGLCRPWNVLNELNDAAEVARDLLGSETREMRAMQLQVAAHFAK
jgi:hypothetical protein